MKRLIAVIVLLAVPAIAIATGTTTIPQQSCPDCICEACPPAPDCICNPAPCKCDSVQCPDVTCPACPESPDCNLTCPDPCPAIDDDESRAGVYTMIGIGGASAWNTAEVTLGTFTIFGTGDIGWGYQCVVAGGTDRLGCQAYMLRRK